MMGGRLACARPRVLCLDVSCVVAAMRVRVCACSCHTATCDESTGYVPLLIYFFATMFVGITILTFKVCVVVTPRCGAWCWACPCCVNQYSRVVCSVSCVQYCTCDAKHFKACCSEPEPRNTRQELAPTFTLPTFTPDGTDDDVRPSWRLPWVSLRHHVQACGLHASRSVVGL